MTLATRSQALRCLLSRCKHNILKRKAKTTLGTPYKMILTNQHWVSRHLLSSQWYKRTNQAKKTQCDTPIWQTDAMHQDACRPDTNIFSEWETNLGTTHIIVSKWCPESWCLSTHNAEKSKDESWDVIQFVRNCSITLRIIFSLMIR